MISLHGVPSSLIARNESWVRRQAQSIARRVPSNVEKADLIQVGLIAVAQAALSFRWDGVRDSAEAEQAFVRYARNRVQGAMLDELRQMDRLGRTQRRKIKVVQIARERWMAQQGHAPGLAELSEVCGLGVDEIAELDQLALHARSDSLDSDDDGVGDAVHHPSTPHDEVEARVDTAIVMRRLEAFFAQLPERERQVIDAHLGVGMSPAELARAWRITPSRVAQIYKSACRRIARHLGHTEPRALDGRPANAPNLDALVAAREAEFASTPAAAPWDRLMEQALTRPAEAFGGEAPRLKIDSSTRWS